MDDFERTGLWKRTLAARGAEDTDADARESLRASYFKFRERAQMLAGEIARDLPDFTVHDITHLDALWETADLIAGEEYDLTPIEGFILGGAFLIHDLGLGLAAYPGGAEELRKNVAWSDMVTTLLKSHLGRKATTEELAKPPPEVERAATEQVLRNQHAARAEKLATIAWENAAGEKYHLIEDADRRREFGPLIGRLGHSHWWPVGRLEEEFGQVLGAPAECPGTWTLDPLKLACLLRVADAAHLYGRAPGFLAALRRLPKDSKDHWDFQERLQKPQIEGDRLVYTSPRAFTPAEADSWWLCHETLRMVDSELRQVDALLGDSRRERLLGKAVAGVEDAARLAKYVKTDSWVPVNTTIKVSDVAALVDKLGGRSLYGNKALVPIRELIQNAADAIRARRLHEEKAQDWGQITVRLSEDGEDRWLEVEDNGIGMSEEVLVGPFLDFGTSYWGSELMQRELPGLASKGFASTGKFGIGFFSVFMLGNEVEVITRRATEAHDETRLLYFSKGTGARPLLRRPSESERLADGGTKVRIHLDGDPRADDGFLDHDYMEGTLSLKSVCSRLCPGLDANLETAESGNTSRVIAARDWLTIEPEELLKRTWGCDDLVTDPPENLELAAKNLRTLSSDDGETVGRAAIIALWRIEDRTRRAEHLTGCVVTDGIACGRMPQVQGILTGETEKASRDTARPRVGSVELARWASEQAELLGQANLSDDDTLSYASAVRQCGGDTGPLKIAETAEGFMTAAGVARWLANQNEIMVVGGYETQVLRNSRLEMSLEDNVLICEIGSQVLIQGEDYINWPRSSLSKEEVAGLSKEEASTWRYLKHTVTGCVFGLASDVWRVPIQGLLAQYMSSETARELKIGIVGDKAIVTQSWTKLSRIDRP